MLQQFSSDLNKLYDKYYDDVGVISTTFISYVHFFTILFLNAGPHETGNFKTLIHLVFFFKLNLNECFEKYSLNETVLAITFCDILPNLNTLWHL